MNWNELVSPGPNQVGFDYSYILAATQDRVPTVYIENGYVVGRDNNDPIKLVMKRILKESLLVLKIQNY